MEPLTVNLPGCETLPIMEAGADQFFKTEAADWWTCPQCSLQAVSFEFSLTWLMQAVEGQSTTHQMRESLFTKHQNSDRRKLPNIEPVNVESSRTTTHFTKSAILDFLLLSEPSELFV
jgi:hypothetical protein